MNDHLFIVKNIFISIETINSEYNTTQYFHFQIYTYQIIYYGFSVINIYLTLNSHY